MNKPKVFLGISVLIISTFFFLLVLTHYVSKQKLSSETVSILPVNKLRLHFESGNLNSGVCKNSSDYIRRLGKEVGIDPRCKIWLNEKFGTSDTFLSQFSQDTFFFNNFYRCMEGPGTYLDIGAYAPESISNTWFLDKCLGWRGICAEADPVQASPFRTQRSCYVVDKAIGKTAGKGTFVGGSTSGYLVEGKATGRTTDVTTIDAVIKETGWGSPLVIDFLSLDVEGHELEVLMSIPWDHVSIKYIALENNRNKVDTWEYLMDQGYIKLGSFGVDEFLALLPANISGPLWWPSFERIDSLRKEVGGYRVGLDSSSYERNALLNDGWGKFLQKQT